MKIFKNLILTYIVKPMFVANISMSFQPCISRISWFKSQLKSNERPFFRRLETASVRQDGRSAKWLETIKLR